MCLESGHPELKAAACHMLGKARRHGPAWQVCLVNVGKCRHSSIVSLWTLNAKPSQTLAPSRLPSAERSCRTPGFRNNYLHSRSYAPKLKRTSHSHCLPDRVSKAPKRMSFHTAATAAELWPWTLAMLATMVLCRRCAAGGFGSSAGRGFRGRGFLIILRSMCWG